MELESGGKYYGSCPWLVFMAYFAFIFYHIGLKAKFLAPSDLKTFGLENHNTK